jgi:hypothetical protein
MAEAIGIAGSIVGILQLTATVLKYLNGVKDASKGCNRILIEVSSVYGLLFNLNNLVERAGSEETSLAMVMSLGVPNGPLVQFESALKRLATHLEPVHGLKKAGRAFIVPFKKEEVTNILHIIERQKTLFILALQNDHM